MYYPVVSVGWYQVVQCIEPTQDFNDPIVQIPNSTKSMKYPVHTLTQYTGIRFIWEL